MLNIKIDDAATNIFRFFGSTIKGLKNILHLLFLKKVF